MPIEELQKEIAVLAMIQVLGQVNSSPQSLMYVPVYTLLIYIIAPFYAYFMYRIQWKWI